MTDIRWGIVIPLYNHRATLQDVVSRALQWRVPVCVVDDGSTDGGVCDLGADECLTVITLPENGGKGGAILAGLTALASRVDWVVTIDADGQHNPAECVRFIDDLKVNSRSRIIVGNRQGMDGDHIHWTSRWGRGFSNFWVQLSGGPAVRDTQTGFRVYPVKETLALGVVSRRYQFEVEVLVRAVWAGLQVSEIPVSVHYPPREERVSHFRPWIDFGRNAKTFARLISLRLFRFLRPIFSNPRRVRR